MRHLLLTIITLFVAGTAMADSYMYIEDFEVPSGEHQITVPVRAHFNAFVSAFQLDITDPDGLGPVETTVGADMAIGYYDNNGRSQTVQLSLFSNELKNRFIAAIMTDGYYDTDGSGNYESYGVVKWEAGYYDEMFLLTMDVMEGFQGGEIILESNLSSGRDTRGETVSTLGETYSTSVCNVTTGPAPLLTLTGDIIIGENVDLMVPVLYTGEEEVTMTISVNGDEVISGNAHQYDLNLPGYGEWTMCCEWRTPSFELFK